MKEANKIKILIEEMNEDFPFLPISLDSALKFGLDRLIDLHKDYMIRISEIKEENYGEDPDDYECEIEDAEKEHPISKVEIDWDLVKNKLETEQELLYEEKQELLLAVIDMELYDSLRVNYMMIVEGLLTKYEVPEHDKKGFINIANEYIDIFLKDTVKE